MIISILVGIILGLILFYIIFYLSCLIVHWKTYGYATRLLKRLDDISLEEDFGYISKYGQIYYFYLNENMEIDRFIYFSHDDDFLISQKNDIYLHNYFLKYIDPYYYYLLSKYKKHFREKKESDINLLKRIELL